MLSKRIGFIGAGKMAQALAKGFIRSGKIKNTSIIASCPEKDTQSVNAFKHIGSKVTFQNVDVLKQSDVIILAVKPFIVSSILKEIKSESFDKLFLSIMMGVELTMLEQSLNKVIRIMSNTAAEICKGTTVYAPGSKVDKSDLEFTKQLLSVVGFCQQVTDEKLLDISTALCGSGPAFVYLFIESLVSGAVKMGMGRDLALSMAVNTVSGATSMISAKTTHPALLKDDVTSPAGSTAMGLYELENKAFRVAVMDALKAATDRCVQISQSKF